MKITKLEVNNFIGITEAIIEPKKMTVIAGKNGQGKTSLIEAIKAAFRGAGADKIKVGSSKAEIFVATDEIEVRRKITAAGSTVTIKKDGMTVSKPQAYLDGIIGDFSFEPVKFFAMSPKEQTAYLLKAIPVKATVEQLKTWTRGLYAGLDALIPLHGLEAIAKAAEALYNLRAGDNSRVKDLEANIQELHDSIPLSARDYDHAEFESVVKQISDAKAIENEYTRITGEIEECGIIERELNEEGGECQQRIEARYKDLEELKKFSKVPEIDMTPLYDKRDELLKAISDVDKEIAKKHSQNMDRKAAIEKTAILDRQISELKDDGKNIMNRITANKSKRSDLEAKLAKSESVNITPLEAKLTELKTAQSFQRDIDRLADMRKEHSEVSARAQERDKAVKTLQVTAPAELLLAAKMPVEGLAYSAGAFTLKGVPIQNLSTSEKARLAVAVTRQLNKDYAIKAICLDGFESLDSDAQKAFMEAADSDSFQYFVTRVSDSAMNVTTK